MHTVYAMGSVWVKSGVRYRVPCFSRPQFVFKLVNMIHIRNFSEHRWFRAVDVPLSKPKVYNYSQTTPATQFEMFSASDCERLEKAFQNNKETEVVETDGLVTVHLKKGYCCPTYWDGFHYEVRRTLWHEICQNKKLSVIDPGVESIVEKKYTTGNRKVRLLWPVNKSKRVAYSGKFSQHNDTTRLILHDSYAWIPYLSKRILVRGIPLDFEQPKTRPPYIPRPVEHIVFCIHGIGQLLSLQYAQMNYVRDINAFRRMILQVADKKANSSSAAIEGEPLDDLNEGDKPIDNYNVTGAKPIQVFPIMWRGLLDTEEELKAQQLFGAPNVAADAVLDFIMYTEPRHKLRIQEIAASEMNRVFKQFCDLNPDFAKNPKVSIIGHSLGSVIAYDLMNSGSKDLEPDFTVSNLFLIGSPLGVLKLVNKQFKVEMGRAKNLFNIMKLSDPVASRLEPLISKLSLGFGPAAVPGDGTNLLQQFKSLTDDLAKNTEILASKASAVLQMIASKEKVEPPLLLPAGDSHLPELEKFNRHGRLDFRVNETIDISLFLGIVGHFMYLDNPDVVRFILDEILINDK